MFTFWFTYDSNSDSFYNYLVYTLSIFSILSLDLLNSLKFSLFETIKINKQKMPISRLIKIKKRLGLKKKIIEKIEIKKIDLINTWCLNVEIIEKEWSTKPNSGIFDGPKYLVPLTDGMLPRLLINFLAVPAKLLHKLFWFDKNMTSCLVRQL